MGRKIPAKKHRGVKDPLVQQARRLQGLKGKINAPPKDPDEQPVPRSLTRLFAFQDRYTAKTNESKKKINQQKAKDRDNISLKNENPIAKLQKLPGESGRGFSLRINSAIKTLHNPTLQEDYPEDMETEDIKGEQMAWQRARRKRKQKKKVTTENDEETAPKLSRVQKLALKKKAKREKALEGWADGVDGVRYERVSFGEVAHAPPSLPVLPRHAKQNQGAPRPGRKQLLLSSLLSGNPRPAKQVLPPAELQRRERARLEAVAAYRALRKSAKKPTTSLKQKS
ncbi:unnamed protein product, partial [Iphiclides podalirius]